MELLSHHLLSVILFTPLVGALVLLFVPRESPLLHKLVGNLFGVLGFVVSLPLIVHFPAGSGDYEFKEVADWIPSIGARYSLGVDGISMLLVMLTTFLGMLAITSSWGAIQQRTKEYYILLLLLQTGMIGVFVSLDFFLFYVFWEVMLVPMYFLIGVWGSDRRLYAAIKFFLYTLAGSVVMLLGILALYFYAPLQADGTRTFDVPTLLAAAQTFSNPLKVWLFWGFFFAFAIKVPMFPFHTWLPDAHTEAPTAGSVILAGVLLKMGTYGFIRFSLPLLPSDGPMRSTIIKIVIVLSLIGIVYGALVLIVGVLYDRRHTRLISEFGGLATPMPNFAAVYLIVSLSSLGMPLLNGFIGEFTILQGAFQVHKAWAAWGTLGVILGAAYLLWLYQRVMFGSVSNPANEHLPDLNLREMATLLPLVALAFWIGVYPKPFFALIEKPVDTIVRQVNPGFYQQERAYGLLGRRWAPHSSRIAVDALRFGHSAD